MNRVRKVTSGGRVTLPIEVRRLLRVDDGGEIEFRLSQGVVVLAPMMTLEQASGSVPALDPPRDLESAMREAKEERVARYFEKLASGDA